MKLFGKIDKSYLNGLEDGYESAASSLGGMLDYFYLARDAASEGHMRSGVESAIEYIREAKEFRIKILRAMLDALYAGGRDD